MLYVTVTPQQKKDIRDGKTVTITTEGGAPIVVTPELVAWARGQIAAGVGELRILPEVAGQNRMEETALTL
jgi:hypothetical protein